ncbi:Urease accessory protein UreE [Burkholderiales bacterium]|nr:Urease accessory protein UreE [Burkholderiales bacterium]
MLMITQRLQEARRTDVCLELPFEARCRSRLRATLSNGEAVAIVVARGQVLRGGDLLLAEDGRVIEICAAAELVSTAHGKDAAELIRAAYHLGNRHVALQISSGWLRYNHDHVLDDMVRGLGLSVSVEQAPFEPEVGAYAPHETASHQAGHAHGPGGVARDPFP